MTNLSCDVAVVGGGPAGSCAATALACEGALVECPRTPEARMHHT